MTACSTAFMVVSRTLSTDSFLPIAAAAGLLTAAISLLSPSPLAAQTTDAGPVVTGPLRLALKGGAPDRGDPTTGLLLSRSCPSGQCGVYARCSGVLGAGDRFFTAAHCLADRTQDYWVFLQNGGIFPGAESGVQHFCDERPGCDTRVHDLAALHLAVHVPDIPPPRLGTVTAGAVRISGFGDSGPGWPDHGILRSAPVTTVPCTTGLLCYRFDADTPAACNHDSGGPMYHDEFLIGLARRSEYGCKAGLGSYTDLTVPAVTDWWHALAGSPSATPASQRQELIIDCTETDCWRNDGLPITDHTINVRPGARRFIVTLNHALLGLSNDCRGGLSDCMVDYDLKLDGPDQDVAAEGCACNNDFFQVAACDCPSPRAGKWRLSILVVGERGPYQVTGRVLY